MTPDRTEAAPVLFACTERDVACSPTQVEAVLGEQQSGWLAGLVEEAGQTARERLQHLDAGGRRFPTQEEVKIHPMIRLGSELVLPLDVRSCSEDAVFPVAEVDLEVAPLQEAASTRIELRARFRASVGRDRTSAALAVAQSFTHRLAALISARLLGHLAA